MLSFATIHRIVQICTAGQDVEKMSSLEQFRHNANQRFTFQRTLLSCWNFFSRSSDVEINVTPNQTKQRPIRTKVKGIVPEVINYASKKTDKTPMRSMAKRIQEGNVDGEIEDRWNNCQGKAMMSLDKNGNAIMRLCSWCNARKTSWWCLGCRAFFCHQPGKSKNKAKKFIVCVREGDEQNYFGGSCFHEKHTCTWSLNN
jgi:hypothetical protein